jgi:hypothetical protein
VLLIITKCDIIQNQRKEKKMELKNVIICDETGLINDELTLFKEMFADDIKDIEIELSKEKAEAVADKYVEDENEAIVLKIYKDTVEEKDVFKIDILVPEASEVTNIIPDSIQNDTEIVVLSSEPVTTNETGVQPVEVSSPVPQVAVPPSGAVMQPQVNVVQETPQVAQPVPAPVVDNNGEFSTPNQAVMPSNTSGVVPPTGVVDSGVSLANIAPSVPVETTNV